jgi:hypothetical protein
VSPARSIVGAGAEVGAVRDGGALDGAGLVGPGLAGPATDGPELAGPALDGPEPAAGWSFEPDPHPASRRTPARTAPTARNDVDFFTVGIASGSHGDARQDVTEF